MALSIPVASERYDSSTVVIPPAPRLISAETGEVKTDRATGKPVYVVGVAVTVGNRGDVLMVQTVGEPAGLTVGTPVHLVRMTASEWEFGDRHGITYRAEDITPAVPAARPSSSGPSSAASSASSASAGKGAN